MMFVSRPGQVCVPNLNWPHLYGVVSLQKQVPAADAAVDAAQGHVEAEGEEVTMVQVAHTVVQPGWKHVQVKDAQLAQK